MFEKETANRSGREITMYHRETDKEKVLANTDAIFDLHGQALDWLEEYTDIPYPFEKFDFVLIPSFQYGGMEHPGNILYRQSSLFLEKTATQQQQLRRASLIAHETAHMWFGDLVTMNWFDDVWTKEVFANFMAAKIVNPAFPEVNHDLRFLMAHHPSAYAVDRTAGANPIRQPLDNLRFAGTLYGAIIYQKAPIVMRHLENRVGIESMREGLREYLSTFSYSNATWPDLIDILDKRSEQDLTAWSKVWVEEAGRPSIEVQRRGGSIVISQTDPSDIGRVWPQTLNILLGESQGVSIESVELAENQIEIKNAADSDYILPNGSGLEYGHFILDSDSVNFLIRNIEHLDSALTRGVAWTNLWEQVLTGQIEPALFLETLMRSLEVEPDEVLLARLVAYLETTYWRLLDEESRAQISSSVETLLWTQTNSTRDLSIRSLFYSAFRELALSESGIRQLEALFLGSDAVEGIPLSESELISLARGLAIRGVGSVAERLDFQRSRIENPDRLAKFDFLRDSLSMDGGKRMEFFESLAEDANRDREAWVVEGLDNLNHPLRANSSVSMIPVALELLEEIQRTGDIFFPGRWLDGALYGHNSIEAAQAVSSFLENSTELSPRMRLKLLQSSDMLFRTASIVNGWEEENEQE